MSLLKITITEDHLKLLKQLRWSQEDNLIVSKSDDEDSIVFGADNIYEAIDLILNGNVREFDMSDSELPKYTDEEKADMDTIFGELPLALDVILFRQSFEMGSFKTTYHDRNWVKVN
jgi:hypothetical protein